jgi:hypothetical protein
MDETIRGAAARTLQPRASQAYDLNLKVTFLPGRTGLPVAALGCQPRQDGQRVDVPALDLPPSTHRFLQEANATVLDWLARDASHQAAFVADPLAALQQAGLKLARSDAKALARLRDGLASAQAITPGLQLRTLHTAVDPKGRAKPAQDRPRWSPPDLNHGCDCNPKAAPAADKKAGV